MTDLITRTLDLQKGDAEAKRLEITKYFNQTWALDDLIYTQLKSDDVFYKRGDSLRHVILFYLGHTAVFYINKLILAKIIEKRINPAFESIFAIGVDEMSWDDLDEKNYQWPTVDEVRNYREQVKQVVLEVIATTQFSMPISWDNPMWIVMMGIEHQRIHIETSSVLLRQLPLEDLVPHLIGVPCCTYGNAPANEYLTVPGASMHLGKDDHHPHYGWDNEYGKMTVEVEDFQASKFLVSNGEFLEFVNDGGYSTSTYWTEEGWNWCQFKQAEMPLFWRKDGDNYLLRLVAHEMPMPWNWPAEVNYLEAKAFCNWKSAKQGETYRLPTEAEWYRLAEHCSIPDVTDWDVAPGNINLEHFASPCPVDMFRNAEFYDVIGNVWQWTETPMTGYPGFKVHPFYDDFTTPTFDGKHNLIKGGSWISTGNEATRHARYAFRRHFYQHAGFRIVKSEAELIIENDEYETGTDIAVSCDSNWGDQFGVESNFAKQLAAIVVELCAYKDIDRVLDLNADTGRLAFELATHFHNITAIDSSARFIRMPIQLQEKGFMRYISKDEGELVFYRDLVLADTALAEGKDKILFVQDNANNLKPIYSGYDLIVAPHVLEEMLQPTLFLENIHSRLNAGGILVIASSYDWDKNNIAMEYRPGGFKKDGEPVTSSEGIEALLSPHFIKLHEPMNVEQRIALSSRHFECRMTEVTFWKIK